MYIKDLIKYAFVNGRKFYRRMKFGKFSYRNSDGEKYVRKNSLFQTTTVRTVKNGKVQKKRISYPMGSIEYRYGNRFTHVKVTEMEKLPDGAYATKRIAALYENEVLNTPWYQLVENERKAVPGTIEFFQEFPPAGGIGESQFVHKYGITDDNIMKIIDW